MVIGDVDRTLCKLCGRMPVADMPGEPHQAQAVFRADFEQLFRRCVDQHQTPIVELQRIAMMEHGGLFEIEKQFETTLARERHAAAVPGIVIERDLIGHPLRPYRAPAHDARGALHHISRLMMSAGMASIVGASARQGPAAARNALRCAEFICSSSAA